MTREQVVKRIRDLVNKAGSQRIIAQRFGVSDAYLGDVLKGQRKPGPKILKHLGLERDLEAYRKVGA